MPAELRLSSFEVEGFRAIRRLSLPVLGRVNLFVGENNAGKSSLLEALQLYLYRNARGLPAVLLQITREHSDLRPPAYDGRGIDPSDLQAGLDAIEGLFFGSFDEQPLRPIRLYPEAMPSTGLTITVPWSDVSDPSDLGTGEYSGRPSVVDPAASALEYASELGTGVIALVGHHG